MRKNMAKFLVVGVGAFVIDYGLTLLLHYEFGVIGYVASAISFTTSFTFSFSLSRRWVFRPKDTYRHSMRIQIIAYFTLAAINLVISSVIIASSSAMNIDVYISKAISVALIACWNFAISHYFIFAEIDQKKG